MTSGYYDPLHEAHLGCFQDATRYGNIWVAVVNGDEASIRKKGYYLIPAKTRASVVASLKTVHFVTIWDENTVDGIIELLKPDVFCKGGDRSSLSNMPEKEQWACRKVKCQIVGGVGGRTKDNSSSDIVQDFLVRHQRSVAS